MMKKKNVPSVGKSQSEFERSQAEEKLRESENRFRSVLDTISLIGVMLDLEGRITHCNDFLLNLTDWKREEIMNQNWFEIFLPPEIRNDIEKEIFLKSIGVGEIPAQFVNEIITRRGNRRLVQWSNTVLRDQNGSVVGVASIGEDITERKQAEEKLRESEASLKRSQAVAHVGDWVWDTQTNRVTWSDEMKRIFGIDPQTFNGNLNEIIAKAIHPDDREKVARSNEAVISERSPVPLEYRVVWPDESVHTVLAIPGERFADEKGNILRLTGIVQDISERKQAEEKIQKAYENLTAAQRIAHIGSHEHDIINNRLYWSDEVFRIFGISRDEFVESPDDFFNRIHPDDKARVSNTIAQAYQAKKGTAFEHRIVHTDGSVRYVEEQFDMAFNEKGEHIRNIGTIQDITGRKQAEEMLKESEEKYRFLFENNPHPMWVYDLKTLAFLAVNESAVQKYGYTREEFLRMTIADIRPVEDVPSLKAYVARQRPPLSHSGEWRHRLKNGNIIDVDITSHTLRMDGNDSVLVVAQDITERKRAEQKIQLQLRRMSALSEIDRAINSGLDLRVSLSILVDDVISQLNVDAASVLLLDVPSQTFEYIAGKGFRSAAIRQSRLRLGEGLSGRVGLERKVLHIPNLADVGDQFARKELLKGEEFVEYFGIPLIAKGMLKGVLEIFHRTPLNSDVEWINYLETLGGQAAIAIDNAQLFEGIQQSNFELITAYDATITGWSHAMDLRDKETEGHTQRVTELTVRLAGKMGVSKQDIVHLRRGALLHDIGKLGVPDNILLKPGKLTDEEWVLMRQHPTYAYEMLLPINYLRPALDIPYCHHEKWDGSGYPRGLKGDLIPLSARIFAIVDVWDALLSDRPYRAGWSVAKTRKYIVEQSGKHFEPRVVKAFLNILDKSPDLK